MKKTILLSNHYEGPLYEILKEAIGDRFDFLMLKEAKREELLSVIGQADYLIMSGKLEIDEELIEKAGKLKMIQRTGVGIDRLDLDVLKKYNIPLYVNKGVNASSVAEFAVMAMLMTLKNACLLDSQMKDGEWKKTKMGIMNHEIAGRRVGLIGMGNIGRKVAEMLQGFHCEIVYYDRFRLSEEDEEKYGVQYLSFDELIETADIISLHCPYDRNTGAIISEKEIEKMKDGVILVNTARGKLIVEEDLIRALKEHKIAGCAIDTFEEEPLDKDSELRKLDNVFLSPHVAGLTYESYQRMLRGAVESVVSFDDGDLEKISDCRII